MEDKKDMEVLNPNYKRGSLLSLLSNKVDFEPTPAFNIQFYRLINDIVTCNLSTDIGLDLSSGFSISIFID